MLNEIYIIGRQRSGTTTLREALSDAGAFNADEIMHGDLSRPHRFYAYVADRIRSDPSFAHPQRHRDLYRDFIKHLLVLSKGQPLAIDIKYFGLNLIPSADDIIGTLPFIPKYIMSSRVHVLHLVRKNKLRVLVSEEIAVKTKVWSATSEATVKSAESVAVIDPATVIGRIKRLLHDDQIASTLLSKHEYYRKLNYEDMFQLDGDFSDTVMELIKSMTGNDNASSTPKTLRLNARPLSVLISNFEQVQDVITNSQFDWMLEQD